MEKKQNLSTELSTSSYDKIMRLLWFVIICFVFLRYLLDVQNDEYQQIKIIIAASIAYIFVNMYYPVVVIKYN